MNINGIQSLYRTFPGQNYLSFNIDIQIDQNLGDLDIGVSGSYNNNFLKLFNF